MSFTAPKTWSFGEILTSTDMNIYVRDNTEALFAGAGSNLVAVKTVVKTDVQATSLGAGNSTAVSGLTIAHAVANSAHKVFLVAQVAGSHSNVERGTGLALTAGGTALNLGNAVGSRVRVSSSFGGSPSLGRAMGSGVLVAVYSPGTTDSVTYGVNAYNVDNSTASILINRSAQDGDGERHARGASVLTLFEVKV